jgi:hypothetical protein
MSQSQQDDNRDLNNDNDNGRDDIISQDQEDNLGGRNLLATPYTNLCREKAKMNIDESKSFINIGRIRKKDQDKALENIVKEINDDKDKDGKTYSELFIDRAQEVDPGMDFLEPAKRLALQKFYSKQPQAMPIKEVKPLKYSKIDKFAANIITNADIIGNAAIIASQAFETGNKAQGMTHLSNILDLSRNIRSEANIERVKVRNPSAAFAIKKHLDGAEIISPAMKDIVKEEKEQGFKKPYYNKQNYFRKRNSFSGFQNNYNNSNQNTFQLAQAIQQLANNQFFLPGGGDFRPIPSNPETATSLHTPETTLEEEENVAFVEKVSTRPDSERGKGGNDSQRRTTCSASQKVAYNKWLRHRQERDNAYIHEPRRGGKILERESEVRGISRYKEGEQNYGSENKGCNKKRCAGSNEQKLNQMVQSLSLGSQSQRRYEIGGGHAGSQSIYGPETFQDGRYPNSRRSYSSERLCSSLRPQGSLQPHSSPSIDAGFTGNNIQGNVLYLPRNALRSERRSPSIHKNNETLHNGNKRNMENTMCRLFRRLVTSSSKRRSPEKDHTPDNPISSILRMDGEPRKISPGTIPTVSISRMELGHVNHVYSTPQNETPQNSRRTPQSTEKNIQKESYTCPDLGQINWDAFSYKNPDFQSISLSSTNDTMPKREGQPGRLGHMVPMDLQDNGRDTMVGQNNKGKPSQIINQTFVSTSSNYYRCSPRRMGSNPSICPRGQNLQPRKRDKKFIINRQTEVNNNRRRKSLLSDKLGRFKVELHRPIRSKSKTKDRKRFLSSSTKMDKKNKTTNIQLQRTYSNTSSPSSFLSNPSEGELQIYSNTNRQLSRNVQHQQESRCSQPLSDNKKNLVADGQKSNVSKSSSYTRKNKHNDRQIKSSRNKRRLSTEPTKLSKSPEHPPLLSDDRSICLEEESINKEICLSNSGKRPRQHRKCFKVKLDEDSPASIDPSSDSFDTESDSKIRKRRKESYNDSSGMERSNMVITYPKHDNLKSEPGKSGRHPNTRKEHDKKKLTSSSWKVRSPIVNEFLEFEKEHIAPGHWKKFIESNRWIKLYFEQLQWKELKQENKQWIFIMELLVKELSIQKLDLFMSSIVESTQKNYTFGWNKFIDFIISSYDSFPQWQNQEDCIYKFQDFIAWGANEENMPSSELNIACSAISKVFSVFHPLISIPKIPLIKSLRRGIALQHPKRAKYKTTWDSNLLLNYYLKEEIPEGNEAVKIYFLQTKIAIFLGFFYMLRPIEIRKLKFISTSNTDYNPDDGLWLSTRLKNQTEFLSDLWIPNMLRIQGDILATLPQNNNNNPLFNMQNTLKLSTYHAIKDLQSLRSEYTEFLLVNSFGSQLTDYEYSHMIKQTFKKMGVPDMYGPYTLKHTAITKLVKLGVELSVINKSARYALNSTTALKYYTAMDANSRTTAILAIKESREVIFQEFQNLAQPSEQPLQEEEKDYEYDELYHEFFGDDEEIENMVHLEEQKKLRNSISSDLNIAKEKIAKVKSIEKKIPKITFTSTVIKTIKEMEKKSKEISDLKQENDKRSEDKDSNPPAPPN